METDIKKQDSPEGEAPLRPWAQIRKDLKRPIKKRHLASKKLGGNAITYVPWYYAQQYLDAYTNGHWHYRVKEREVFGEVLYVTVQIEIQTADVGIIQREGQGNEALSVGGYGDPGSNAESMAFRRACARFGLALSLYTGD